MPARWSCIAIWILLSACLAGPAMAGPDVQQPANGREFYRQTARAEALRHGIPFPLVDAVMRVESGYDPLARGSAGEVGLMQVMPQTAVLLGFAGSTSELAEPAVNIALGTRYLAEAWRLARQDICTTVMKYRAGHGEHRFSQRSVNYCARVRAHLSAHGFRVTGDLPRVNLGRALSSPEMAASGPERRKPEIAGFASLGAVGDWVAYRGGHVWVPRNVKPEWRPYTVGRWAFTRGHGWMWVSSEAFGWATYHYGRWGHAREIGWYWVPGKRWAPAWVYWRRSARYVVWAPLPPSGDGTEISANIDCCAIPRDRWTAVPVENFLDADLSAVVIRSAVKGAQPLGAVSAENRMIVNRALSVSGIEQQTNRKVTVHDVERTGNPGPPAIGRSNQIVVFGPLIM